MSASSVRKLAIRSFWFVILLVSVVASPTASATRDGRTRTYESATYSFDPRSVRIDETDRGYHRIQYEGAGMDRSRSRAGSPQLPITTKTFVLPDETKIRQIELTVTDWDTIPGTYNPEPIETEEGIPGDPDMDVYESMTLYPARPGHVVIDNHFGEYHLGRVTLYPLSYLPAQRRLLIARELTLSISVEPQSAAESAAVLRVLRPEGQDTPNHTFARLVRSRVENPTDFERFYRRPEDIRHRAKACSAVERNPYGGQPTRWPSTEGPPVYRVIITDDHSLAGDDRGSDILTWAQYYADWADALYFQTEVRKVSDILANDDYVGVDGPEKIRNFMIDSYENWGTRFFILAGDTDIIPTRRLGAPDQEDHARLDPPADFYYWMQDDADWNANDDPWEWSDNTDVASVGRLGSWSVGRLPVRDEIDAEIIYKKLIEYREPEWFFEKEPPPASYYQSALFATGMVGSANPTVQNNGHNVTERFFSAFHDHWPDGLLTRLYSVPDSMTFQCGDSAALCYSDLFDYIDAHWSEGDIAWTGDALQDNLNEGWHFVFHYEHSNPDRLGRPTYVRPSESPCGGADLGDWRDSCKTALDSWAGSNPTYPLTAHKAYELTNGVIPFDQSVVPEYSIMMSLGSWTNAFDVQTVSESLLQAPNGGAVAYLGKNQSPIGAFRDIMAAFIDVLLDPEQPVGPELGTALYWAIVNEVDWGEDIDMINAAYRLPFLGDPGMFVFRDASVVPVHVDLPEEGTMGAQSMRVTVTEEDAYGNPVEGALVSLRQDSLMYAVAATDADGVAQFGGLVLVDTLDVLVSASHQDYYSASDTLGVSASGPFLAYDGHEVDDYGTNGDGDEVLERGETAKVKVILRNRGTATAQVTTTPNLTPAPSVFFDLDINDEFRPENIFIGAEDGNPPAVADTFRLPVTWEGLSVYGEPDQATTKENYRIWREDADDLYFLKAESPSESPDSLFTGTLKTVGGFSDVVLYGEAGVDSVYAGADSIWFSLKGDASPDSIAFRAELDDWVTITKPSPVTRYVAPGDTASWTYELNLTADSPNQYQMVFTSSARGNPFAQVWSHSDFSIPILAPDVRMLVVDWEFGDFAGGCDTSAVLRPLVINQGPAQADSVALILRVTDGPATVLDSLVTLGRIEADSVVVTGDSMVFCADDYEDLVSTSYEIELQEHYQHGGVRRLPYDVGPGEGGPTFPKPAGLFTDPGGHSITLRWNPVTICSGLADRYMIYLRNESTGADSLDYVAEAIGASRIEITEINGERIEPIADYQFAVRACKGLLCSPPSLLSEPDRPWLPEGASYPAWGFPKVVPSGISTPPTIIWLNSRPAVFVGGRQIYAWWADTGAALRGNGDIFQDGFFYDPELPDNTESVFVGKLVELDWYQDQWNQGKAIVGNVTDDCLYVIGIECDYPGCEIYRPNFLWKKCLDPPSGATAPTVAKLSPTGDLANEWQVILPGRIDSLYVWMDDGEPYLENFSSGAFAKNSTTFNIGSVAILPGEPFDEEVSHIVQAERDGRVVCWETPSRTSVSLATPVWTEQVETNDDPEAKYLLSTPAVGDVDGDGKPEIVVTNRTVEADSGWVDGRVIVLDHEQTGATKIEYEAADTSWVFLTWDGPASRPVLACLDPSVDGLEIVAGGTVFGVSGDEATSYRAHVFTVDARITELSCTERVPVPSRFGIGSSPARVSQEPTVLDLEADGEMDILAPTDFTDIFAVSYIDETECTPKAGWPIDFGGQAFAPSSWAWGVLVSSNDKTVHGFQLSEADTSGGGWYQFGYDSYNSGSNPDATCGSLGRGIAAPSYEGSLALLTPTPSRGSQIIRYHLTKSGRVEISVLDVLGRRIRQLVSESEASGAHEAVWNGRNDRGHLVPSGIYFYHVQIGGREEVRRTVLVR